MEREERTFTYYNTRTKSTQTVVITDNPAIDDFVELMAKTALADIVSGDVWDAIDGSLFSRSIKRYFIKRRT